jgi:hypothetical protein
MWIIKKSVTMGFEIDASFQTIKSSFGCSELWRPQNNALYKEWKDFKERKRIERRDESLWQRMVRTATGYSPQRSKIVETSNTPKKY